MINYQRKHKICIQIRHVSRTFATTRWILFSVARGVSEKITWHRPSFTPLGVTWKWKNLERDRNVPITRLLLRFCGFTVLFITHKRLTLRVSWFINEIYYIIYNIILLGEISSRNVSVTGSLNEFFYQQCTWVLDSNVERQLYIDITSEQVYAHCITVSGKNMCFYFEINYFF